MAFDYLIVGGGLAGLVIASRLSENPSVTVCVLEAGGQTNIIPDVHVPGYLRNSLGKPNLDWMFFSTPQSHASERQIYMPRGKGLGGSSMLNFMALVRPSSGDCDGIEALGNEGWNWETFLRYTKKSETFTPYMTSADEYRLQIHIDPRYHGTSGPIQKTQPRWFHDWHLPFIEALESLGVSYNVDPASGDTIGVLASNLAIHPETVTRSYSSSAYYEPNKDRENLHVITGAHVSRVIVTPSDSGKGVVVATGVEYIKDGEKSTLKANKEVVLCAGAFQTPQILELSGIGDSATLSQHGITQIIDLPGEHPWVPVIFKAAQEYESMDAINKPEIFEKYRTLYETEKKGMFSSCPSTIAFLPLQSFTDDSTRLLLSHDLAAETADANGGFAAQVNLQKEWLDNNKYAQLILSIAPTLFIPPGLDFLPEPGNTYITMMPTIPRPLSRGSVHIQSKDPLAPPAIDPELFAKDFDLDLIIQGIKYARKVAATEPLRSGVLQEVYPGAEVVTDDRLRAFARKSVWALFHPVGTSAMMPREQGGVVSPDLVVYGTRNLRVVDASIIPLQFGSHTQSGVYAIAEKAADLIKAS